MWFLSLFTQNDSRSNTKDGNQGFGGRVTNLASVSRESHKIFGFLTKGNHISIMKELSPLERSLPHCEDVSKCFLGR